MKKNNIINNIMNLLKSFWKDPLFLRHWEDPFYTRRRNDNQLSVRVVGPNRGRSDYYNGGSIMFIEDMFTGIMPYMLSRGEREKYPARIEPAAPEKESMLADGISGRGPRSHLADALCDFVRNTAQVLFSDGVVTYEIVFKKNESRAIEELKFELLQSLYLFRFFKSYYQVVPWWVAKASHVKVQIVRIPAEKILQINFPNRFGRKRKIIKVLKRLWQLSKELIPKFQMESMERNIDIGFDLKEYSLAKYLEIAILTKEFGWNQRQHSSDYISEYYSMLRFLREKKLEAVIREEIISGLNRAINGSLLNFGVSVIMENLFSVSDVEAQEKILRKGDTKFIDIFDALKI